MSERISDLKNVIGNNKRTIALVLLALAVVAVLYFATRKNVVAEVLKA